MFVRPEEVIKIFGLEPGMVVADFGCGSGHYSLRAAKMVSPSGIVYAIDIQKDLLGALKSQAEINNIKNINIIWADLDKPNGSRLKDESVDFVIISNILFQAEDKNQIAKEAFRILKRGGGTGVVEWSIPIDNKDSLVKAGPPLEQRISKEKAKNIFLEIGFVLDKEFIPGDDHYGLIFKKK